MLEEMVMMEDVPDYVMDWKTHEVDRIASQVDEKKPTKGRGVVQVLQAENPANWKFCKLVLQAGSASWKFYSLQQDGSGRMSPAVWLRQDGSGTMAPA